MFRVVYVGVTVFATAAILAVALVLVGATSGAQPTEPEDPPPWEEKDLPPDFPGKSDPSEEAAGPEDPPPWEEEDLPPDSPGETTTPEGTTPAGTAPEGTTPKSPSKTSEPSKTSKAPKAGPPYGSSGGSTPSGIRSGELPRTGGP